MITSDIVSFDSIIDPLSRIEAICEAVTAGHAFEDISHYWEVDSTPEEFHGDSRLIDLIPFECMAKTDENGKEIDEVISERKSILRSKADDLIKLQGNSPSQISSSLTKLIDQIKLLIESNPPRRLDYIQISLEQIEKLNIEYHDLYSKSNSLEEEKCKIEETTLILVDRIRYERHSNESKYSELLAESHAFSDTVEGLKSQLIESQKSNQLIQSQYEVIAKNSQHLQNQYSNNEQEHEQAKDLIIQLTSRLEQVENELSVMLLAKETATTQLANKEEELRICQEQRSVIEMRKSALESDLVELKGQHDSLEEVAQSWQEYCQQNEARALSLEQTLQDARGEKVRLEERLRDLELVERSLVEQVLSSEQRERDSQQRFVELEQVLARAKEACNDGRFENLLLEKQALELALRDCGEQLGAAQLETSQRQTVVENLADQIHELELQRSEMAVEFESRLQELEIDKNVLVKELSVARSAVLGLESQLEALESLLQQERSNSARLELAVSGHKEQLFEVMEQLRVSDGENSVLAEALSTAKASASMLREESLTIGSKLSEAEDRESRVVADLSQRLEESQRDREMLQEELSSAQSAIENMSRALSLAYQSSGESDSAAVALDILLKEKNALQDNISQQQHELQRLQSELSQHQERNNPGVSGEPSVFPSGVTSGSFESSSAEPEELATLRACVEQLQREKMLLEETVQNLNYSITYSAEEIELLQVHITDLNETKLKYEKLIEKHNVSGESVEEGNDGEAEFNLLDLSSSVEAVQKENKRLGAELTDSRETIDSLQRTVKVLARDKANVDADYRLAQANLSNMGKENGILERQLKTLQLSLESVQGQLVKLQLQSESDPEAVSLRGKLEVLNNENAVLSEELTSSRARLLTLEHAIQVAEDRESRVVADLSQRLEESQRDREMLQEELSSAQSAIENMSQRLRDKLSLDETGAVNHLHQLVEELQLDKSGLQGQLEEAQSLVDTLSEQLETQLQEQEKESLAQELLYKQDLETITRLQDSIVSLQQDKASLSQELNGLRLQLESVLKVRQGETSGAVSSASESLGSMQDSRSPSGLVGIDSGAGIGLGAELKAGEELATFAAVTMLTHERDRLGEQLSGAQTVIEVMSEQLEDLRETVTALTQNKQVLEEQLSGTEAAMDVMADQMEELRKGGKRLSNPSDVLVTKIVGASGGDTSLSETDRAQPLNIHPVKRPVCLPPLPSADSLIDTVPADKGRIPGSGKPKTAASPSQPKGIEPTASVHI